MRLFRTFLYARRKPDPVKKGNDISPLVQCHFSPYNSAKDAEDEGNIRSNDGQTGKTRSQFAMRLQNHANGKDKNITGRKISKVHGHPFGKTHDEVHGEQGPIFPRSQRQQDPIDLGQDAAA